MHKFWLTTLYLAELNRVRAKASLIKLEPTREQGFNLGYFIYAYFKLNKCL